MQVCVMHGLIIKDNDVKKFEKEFEDMGFGITFLECVKTNPDVDESGEPIAGTGGRSDVLFKIEDKDINKFAIPRLSMGIRWWEDVVKYNNGSHLYSNEILDKYPATW